MDVREYILSGTIEAYVLGIASEQEIHELEQLRLQYPEIEKAIEACQQDMELLAMQGNAMPPRSLKEEIWKEIQAENALISESKREQTPETQVLRSEKAATNKNWIKYLAAAAIIGLIISVGILVNNQKKNEANVEQIAKIKADNKQLQIQNQLLQSLTKPDVRTVVLLGIKGHEQDKAVVYWDTTSKEVYLNLNNLPSPPKGKQYQLWAIVKGKPVDAGVFDSNNPEAIQKLKTITGAEMFAITLEQAGGSPTPTMTAMYVAGKI